MTQYQLFDALPAHIEDALRASIERFGVLVPVSVDQDGNILDGHHRKRIADELKVPYDRLIRHCADDDERREIARTLNADRRQLSEEQRREVAKDLRERGHSLRSIAGALGTSKDTVARDLEIVAPETIPDRVVRQGGGSYPSRRPQIIARDNREQERAQTALAVVPDVNANRTLDVKRVERVAREQEAERRRSETIETVTAAGEVEIRHGDFRDILDDLAGTADAIITDPPYPREYWPLYAELGAVAAKILKPNGILAVMTGTRLEMVETVDNWITKHMRPRHRGIYLTPGQRWRDQVERVATGWKPILIYAHPDATDLPWINDDVFTSSGTREADQRFHHWGQNESGIADLIRGLTEPGHLVVDCFLGGGTTAVVCKDLGRRFIGCDIDAGAVTTSRERVG